ncbi:MAG: ribosomal protein S18-alanine N-acetyltransferase [Acidimicrobiia bacterium]
MVVNFLIRPMAESDIGACLQIEEATYPVPWTEGIFKEEMVAAGRTYLVAEGPRGIAGYAGLMVVLPDAHVTSVTVDPALRGRNVGTGLMLELATAARMAGARSLTLEVRVSNRSAQALYTKFGMAPVGVRKLYYRDEDALIMWVHDVDSDLYGERLDAIRQELGS